MLIATPIVTNGTREKEKIKRVKYDVIKPKIGKRDHFSGKQI